MYLVFDVAFLKASSRRWVRGEETRCGQLNLDDWKCVKAEG